MSQTFGAVKAITAVHKDPIVVSFDAQPEALKDIKAGTVIDASVGQFPFKVGALAVKTAVAVAQARLGAARCYLHQTLADVWQAVAHDGVLNVDQQVAVRLAATHATHEAAAVVDTAYSLAGSNAIFEDRPFERRFRDIHAVTQQLQGRKNHYEHVGRYLLGLEPETAFL